MMFPNDNNEFSLDKFLLLTCFYDILGINRKAGRAEIRQSYIRLVLVVHPDKQKTPEERVKATKAFVKLKEAYDTLHDGGKRATYDFLHPENTGTRAADSGHYNWQKYRHQQQQQQQQQEEATRRRRKEAERRHQQKKQQRKEQERQRRRQEEQERHQEEEATRRRRKEAERRHKQKQQREEQERQRRRQEEEELLRRRQEARRREQERREEERRRQSSRGQRTTTFGVTAKGEPCKRCKNVGGYCWQHKSQEPLHHREETRNEPSPGTERRGPSTAGRGSDPYSGVRHFGINKNGTPCKDCIKKVGYCYRHTNQDPRYHGGCRSNSSSKPQPTPMYVPFGRCKNGRSCKDCEKKGDFCWRHVSQRT